MVKYRLSTFGTSCNWPRVISPTPGRSTLITSAPNHASNCVQVGPDWTWVKSRMRTPASAFVIYFSLWICCSQARSLLSKHALRIEVSDAAALGAGCRIDHRVDQCWLAGVHGLVHGALQFGWRRRIDANAAERLHHLVVARTLDEDVGLDIRGTVTFE